MTPMKINPEIEALSDELVELMGLEGFIDNSRYHEVVGLLAYSVKGHIKSARWLENMEKQNAI